MAAADTDQLSALDKLLSPQLDAIRQAKPYGCDCVEDVKSLLRAFMEELRSVYGLSSPSAPQEHMREEGKDDEHTSLVVDRRLSEEPTGTTVHPPSSLPIIEDEDEEISHPGITCDSCQQALRGMRYRCNLCPAFNVCGNCEREQAAATRHGGELRHTFTEITDPTPAVVPPPPITPPKPLTYVHVPVEERDSISSMISRVLEQTNSNSNSSKPPKLWLGAEHSPMAPRVMRYESDATLVASSSEKHTPLDKVPYNDLMKSYDETCNKCGFALSGARYKCSSCPSHELCPSCFNGSEANHSTHSFAYIPPKKDYLTSRDQHRASCNLCRHPIFGTCYKCLHPVCSSVDLNLCAACESDGGGTHPLDHPLLKIRIPDSWHPVLGLGKSRCPSVGDSEESRSAGVRRARGSATPNSISSEGAQSLKSLPGYGGQSWLGYGYNEAGLGLRPYDAAF